jgi:hypothetical protein
VCFEYLHKETHSEHKTILNKCRRIQIIQSAFSNLSGIQLEIIQQKRKKNLGNPPNSSKLNNTMLNNQWIKENIKRKIRKYCELNGDENAAC